MVNLSKMDRALFLGAGASFAFGIPTTSVFMEQLKNKNFQTTALGTLLNKLIQLPGIEDIEHIYGLLSDFEDIPQSAFLRNFLSHYSKFPKIKGWEKFEAINNGMSKLKEEIEEEIFSQYIASKHQIFQAVSLYEKIFTSDYVKRKGIIRIFTTNYDNIIEDTFYEIMGRFNKQRKMGRLNKLRESSDYKIIDGFTIDERRRPIYDKNEFERLNKKSKSILIGYYKLHGSIFWKLTPDNKIERVNASTYRSPIHSNPVLYYPGEQKEPKPKEEPYVSQHEELSKCLKNINRLIVIGYQFRDLYLNSIFRLALRDNSELKIIIICGNGGLKAKHNLLNGERKFYESRIMPINLKLSEDTYSIIQDIISLSDRKIDSLLKKFAFK